MTLKSLIIPVCVSLLAVLAPFFFPWPVAFALGIFASFFVPAIAILNGALIDLLYFGGFPGHLFSSPLPYFTIFGSIIAILAAFVQQFIKTRIMS